MLRLHRDERGQSLVIVLSLITIMFLLGSSLAVHSSVALRSTRASEGQGDDFYAADAATELGIWWQRNGKAGNPPAQTINGVTTSTTITSVGGVAPCTGDPRPVWISGFESGALIRASGTANSLDGGFAFVQGTGASPGSGFVDVVSSPARTGSHALRVAPNFSSGNYAYLEAPGSILLGPTVVAHVAIRFGALPTADAPVFAISPGGSTGWLHPSAYIYYKVSSGKWAVGLGMNSVTVFQESSVAAVVGTWYSFDIRFPVTASNVRTAEWYIDGVAQPTVTVTDAAGSGSNPRVAFGQYNMSGSAYTAYFDDVEISTTAADFPLGPVNVVPLLPNGSGIGAGPPSGFQNNDNSAINATSWQRIDEQPMTVLTDYLKQVGGNNSHYVEVTFQDTAETCIRGASIVAALHAAATQANNVSIFSVANGVSDRIWTGDSSNTTLWYLQSTVTQDTFTPGAGPWNQGVINGLTAQFGFSTDFSPNPYLDGIILETAVHPLTGGPATITIVGTGGGSTITTDYLDAGAGIPTLNTWTTTK